MIAWRDAAATMLALSGVAGAQPADAAPDPTEPSGPADPEAPLASVDDPDPRSAGYPRSLVDRPLILPSGLLEGTLAFGVRRADGGTWTTRIGPSLRYAAGPFEIEGGASFLLDDLYSDALVGAHFGPNPDMTVGVQFAVENIGIDVMTLTPRLVLRRKQLLTETFAVESTFALGLSRSETLTAYVTHGEVRVQQQVAPLYAVQARLALSARYQEIEGTSLRHNYGLGVLASLTPTIDIFPSIDLLAQDDDYLGLVFSLAVSARNRR